ncbi:MAG: lipocalin family protein [Bacteroidales bacterium]
MKNTDTTPVTGFELERYLGTWYEIARYPHSFEKGLTGVTATYSMKENGKVEVLNAGFKDSLDGTYKTARGKAKFAGDPSTGHLKVSFFLFFYADYFIMDLDMENYNWALIGSSSPKYLWILCRDSHMDEELYQQLCHKAVEKGYDLAPLNKVPQPTDL